MKLKIRSPFSDAIVEFNISHLISNKTLKFANNDEVHCDSGVYHFNDIEKLVYTKSASEKFDVGTKDEGTKESKKTIGFSFFQREVIRKCTHGPVLSFGCGTMYWDNKLKINLPFVPLDLSRHMLRVAVRKGRTKFAIQADGTNLPFADKQFELTYCIDAMPSEYYAGPESRDIRKKMLNEMYRVTNKGGRVVLLLPNVHHTRFLNIRKKLQNRRIDEYGIDPSKVINEILETGFEITHFSYQMNLCPFSSKNLIYFWNALISSLKLNFLGMIFIELKVP